MRNAIFTLLYVLALLWAADRAESSQSKFGAIDAHVVSKQGAAVDDAKVSVKHITSGYSDHCRTDKNGDCRLENPPTGTYKVTVEAAGFKALRLSAVKVDLDQVLPLPLTLEPALQPRVSMVGYIDDAIIGSQIRIRFDAAFHDNAPDRAEFFYPQYRGNTQGAPGPDYPGASNNVNFQHLYFQAEYAPVSRFSIFTELPVRWIHPGQMQNIIPCTFASQTPNPQCRFPNSTGETPDLRTRSGISDARAGLKVALATSSNHALSFQFKAYFPSGDSHRGLGTAHYSIEPSLLYYQRLSRRWAVESQIGEWHPIGGSMAHTIAVPTRLSNFAGDVFSYGIGPSYQLIDREHFKFAPVVELFGWSVLGGLQTLSPFMRLRSNKCLPDDPTSTIGCSYDASGTNIINLKVGGRTSIGRHNSFYVGFGHAVTHSRWYQEIVRIEYRYSF